jgi:PAS domain S-box-containing protein
LAVIFDHLPDGIIVISGTKPGLVSSINAVACRILGVEKHEVVGKRIESVFAAHYAPLLQIVKETYEQNRSVKKFNLEIGTAHQRRIAFLANTVLLEQPEVPAKRIILILQNVSEVAELPGKKESPQRFETLVGSTAAIRNVFSLIETVAPTDAAILIYGETGTGKELVARAIHQRSLRAKMPFVPVHCSALTSSLLESDLFGHVRGAFTGAIRDKPGRFEMADGGTVFLDEIATLSQEIQINLLRVLQEKTIERVGDTKSTNVDVRIISATNHSLPDLIRQGVFRKDLYYRLKVIQINLPSLEQRKSDIPILTQYFVDRFNRQHGCNILGVTKETMGLLKRYPWPGNVRELENAIEHAVIISRTNMIEPSSIPEEIRAVQSDMLGDSPGQSVLADEVKIRKVLLETGGNVTRTAKRLGIHRTTLWRKMRELGIPRVSEYTL